MAAAVQTQAPETRTIPVLDLAPLREAQGGGGTAALERLGAELRAAFATVGFYFVRNHGVPQELLDRTFAAARQFHDMPLERKLALKINEHNIGYMPMRGATTRMNVLDGEVVKPNANEAVFFKRDLPADHPDVLAGKRFRGLNQWPEALPGFRDTITRCCAAFEGLGRSLLPVYARALELPSDHFAPFFREPMFTLRMSHYPQQAPDAPGNEYGIAPHVDTSFMTILAQNAIPGLSLRTPEGTWIDAPAPEGALLINGGMLLRRWTGRRFLATPHRVINRSGAERYAIPFFMDASYDAVMTPLPRPDAENEMPITYAEFMTGYQKANFHHAQGNAQEKGEQAVQLQGA